MITDYEKINSLAILSDNTAAVCGDSDPSRLRRYNLETGKELSSYPIEFAAIWIAGMELKDESSLVLSYG